MDKDTEAKISDGRIRIITPLEFHFETSECKESVHVVDLQKYEGSGDCTCQNFEYRIRPRLIRGDIDPHEPESQCKHIITAKMILGDRLIKQSIRTFGEAKETITKKDTAEAFG